MRFKNAKNFELQKNALYDVKQLLGTWELGTNSTVEFVFCVCLEKHLLLDLFLPALVGFCQKVSGFGCLHRGTTTGVTHNGKHLAKHLIYIGVKFDLVRQSVFILKTLDLPSQDVFFSGCWQCNNAIYTLRKTWQFPEVQM